MPYLKTQIPSRDFLCFLGILSRSRDRIYSSTAARVVVHCDPIFFALRRPFRAYVRRECFDKPAYSDASCSEISSPMVSESGWELSFCSCVIGLWYAIQHSPSTNNRASCSDTPLPEGIFQPAFPLATLLKNFNTSALNSCGCSIFG